MVSVLNRGWYNTDMSSQGNCHLCDKHKTLVLSHIVPGFIFRWLKDTSGTGHIRFGETPNRRIQDGYKCYLLCSDCEGILSSWERTFAEEVFVPLHEEKGPAPKYGPWLAKFAVSVSWRVLLYFQLIGALKDFPKHHLIAVDRALRIWKKFLLGQCPHPMSYEQHMLPMGIVVDFKGLPDIPPNINRYILRTVDLDIGYDSTNIFVYSKMCKVMLVGFINIKEPKQWGGTKLHINKGILGSKKYSLPDYFGEYQFNRARRIGAIQEKLSLRQKEKIDLDYIADPERAIRSETFEAMDQDVFLFGRAAFRDDKS